jgi:catechol 2,3-dioxygenase-like lactoylglutathione lyase family enzyme
MPDYGVIPSIRVGDMARALAFYESVLGFTVRRGDPAAEHCSLERGSASIMLEVAASF